MDTRYPGITVRNNSIIISFTDENGIRHRESIYVGGPPNKTMLKDAYRKRQAILYEISIGAFDYAKHFPNSKKAIKYGKNRGNLITVEKALDEWLRRHQHRCAHSTLRSYISAINEHLIPSFGSMSLGQLSPMEVKNWIARVQHLSPKSINNVMVPLRAITREAFEEGIIAQDPMQRVRNLRLTPKEPDPFNLPEITAILNQLDGQYRNLIQFAFWTGLRTSELIGLQWQDIDLDGHCAYIRRAVVQGREKTTKTVSGLRTLELEPQAVEALLAQAPFTRNAGKWVFHDPKINDRWRDDRFIRKRVWIPALKAAGIKYRNPYQTRHTYASMMLSEGRNPMWVAQQMGHRDWGMIRKIYGRWIKDMGVTHAHNTDVTFQEHVVENIFIHPWSAAISR